MRAHRPPPAARTPLRLAALVATLVAASLAPAGRSAAQPRTEDKLATSVGPNGINARGLGSAGVGPLTGAGIGIGQVEQGRPGLPGFDNAANSNPAVTPAGVFIRNAAAVANANVQSHAEQVAGVMISRDQFNLGVAPGASLFSSAYVTAGTNPGYQHAVQAMQHVATRNGGDVRAINLSFGKPLQPTELLDGNSLFTQGLDWSARVHDALYVVAGNEGAGGIPVPTDEYNGVTVAFTRRSGGVFREVDPVNNFAEDALGARRSTDLVAPGRDITMPVPGGGFAANSGTSFAAPHVTGTVALLQQFGDARIAAAAPHWDGDARRHEVMKAVLMNSVDKVEDTGDGKLLGMEKTIIDTHGADWLASDAYTSRLIPLDDEMGTGQLNAARALRQFRPGEWDSFGSAAVPLIGWDYGLTIGAGDLNKYVFDRILWGGSYVSITLAWDREVELTEAPATANGSYDIGETFNTLGLTDMDLFLLPKGATDISQNIWSSISFVDPVEHIFFQIPRTGEYEFWVYQHDQPLGDQRYAVAWWAATIPEPSTVLLVAGGLAALAVARRRRA